MRTIAILAIKGGAGKSSLGIHFTKFLLSLNKKVLFIDFDIQNSATFYFYDGEDERSAAAALFDGKKLKPYIIEISENLSLLQSSMKLLRVPGISPAILSNLLNTVKDEYDWCIIDTPPTWNILNINAIVASDIVLTPVITECMFNYKSAKGIREQFEYEIQEALPKWKLIFNRYRHIDSPYSTVQEYEDLYLTEFDNFMKTKIPETKLYSRAIDGDLEVKDNKTWSKLYKCLLSLYQELYLLTTKPELEIIAV